MTDAKYRTIPKRFLPVGVDSDLPGIPTPELSTARLSGSETRKSSPSGFFYTAAGQTTPETSKLFIIASLKAGFPTTDDLLLNSSHRLRITCVQDLLPRPGHVPRNLPHLPTTGPTPQNFATSSTSGKGSKLSPRDVPSHKSRGAQSSENRWNHGLSGNAPQTGFRRGFDRSTDRPRKRPSSRPSFFCSFFFLPSRLLLLLLLPSASRCWVTHYKVLLARASQPDGRRHETPYLSSSNYSPEGELQGVL